MHPSPSTVVPFRGTDPRHVNIRGTSYIPSHIPSSSTSVPSNAFLMTHTPPKSHGPSVQSSTVIHVHPESSHIVVSQGYVPAGYVQSYGPSYGPSYGASYGQTYKPYGSRYQPAHQSPKYGFVEPQPQGTPNYNTQPYMGQMGGCYYPIVQAHGVYNNKTYVNQPYQGAWNQMAQPRLPFLSTLNLLEQQRLTNDPMSHEPAWPVVLAKLPLDIPKF